LAFSSCTTVKGTVRPVIGKLSIFTSTVAEKPHLALKRQAHQIPAATGGEQLERDLHGYSLTLFSATAKDLPRGAFSSI
jgi:hypothetical protein